MERDTEALRKELLEEACAGAFSGLGGHDSGRGRDSKRGRGEAGRKLRGGTGSNKFAHELSVNLSAAKEAAKNERPPRLFVPEEKHAAPRILLQGADLFKFLRNDAGEPSVNKRSPPKKTQTLCSLHMVFPPPSGMVREIPAAFPSQAI